MAYSEQQLTDLAKNNPKELARFLSSPNTDIHTLTFGVEVLGELGKDEGIVLPVLRRLLKHMNAIIREGAMMGISTFYLGIDPPQDIIDRLSIMALNDPSPECRDCAETMLKGYGK